MTRFHEYHFASLMILPRDTAAVNTLIPADCRRHAGHAIVTLRLPVCGPLYGNIHTVSAFTPNTLITAVAVCLRSQLTCYDMYTPSYAMIHTIRCRRQEAIHWPLTQYLR